TRRAGQMLPYENLQTERKTGVALPSPFTFRQHGQSGIPISDLFPHLSRCADELAVIRSMHVELPSHELSLMLMNTGDQRLVRPSFGSWLTWGMGSENQNLPAFVALCPGGMPVGGAANWRSAFLPGSYQGTHVDTSQADPRKLIDHIRNARLGPQDQQRQFDLLRELNADHLASRPGEAALESRIRSFELAYRMQMEATDAFDVDQEPAHIRKAYGEGPQNRQLLIARRLVERVALRADVAWQFAAVGQSFEHPRRASQGRPGMRSGPWGFDHGSEAAGHAGEHPHLVHRGVRENPIGGDGAKWIGSRSGPGPQPLGLLALDGRRRHQGRNHPWSDR
ncbi:MAG: hypothetical protein RLZZ34_922, partial [Verrucomicrobiota bacterium]